MKNMFKELHPSVQIVLILMSPLLLVLFMVFMLFCLLLQIDVKIR